MALYCRFNLLNRLLLFCTIFPRLKHCPTKRLVWFDVMKTTGHQLSSVCFTVVEAIWKKSMNEKSITGGVTRWLPVSVVTSCDAGSSKRKALQKLNASGRQFSVSQGKTYGCSLFILFLFIHTEVMPVSKAVEFINF